MKSTPLVRRGLGVASAISVALAAWAPIPAHAAPNEIVVAVGGSDTTDPIMGQIATFFTGAPVNVGGTKTVGMVNVPAFIGNPTVVPADTLSPECSAVTWAADTAAVDPPTKGIAPFGSTAGRAYLKAQQLDTVLLDDARPADRGCIDVARSSSAPSTVAADTAETEFFAFAMDAVAWATKSLKAPATLSRQQLTDIYDCVVTNWDQVGGSTGAIKRYYPQSGSGTRSFFSTDIMIGKSSSYTPPTVAQNAACPSEVVFIEENQGTTIANVDLDKALVPYSAAVWTYHETNRINPSIDRRGGARLGGMTVPGTPSVFGSHVRWIGGDNAYSLDPAFVSENNVKVNNATPAFPGVRYVYNALNFFGNTNGYQAAKQLLGFTNSAGGVKSPMCDVNEATGLGELANGTITSFGFAALSTGFGGAGATNVAGSNCRRYLPGHVVGT